MDFENEKPPGPHDWLIDLALWVVLIGSLSASVWFGVRIWMER